MSGPIPNWLSAGPHDGCQVADLQAAKVAAVCKSAMCQDKIITKNDHLLYHKTKNYCRQ